jgi:hypothetical protein
MNYKSLAFMLLTVATAQAQQMAMPHELPETKPEHRVLNKA